MKELIEKIKKEGKILPGDILKVDNFLNHQVDTQLLDKIGTHIYHQFKDFNVDKILTVEASGIAIATVTALQFNCPFVFAKKSKTKNIYNNYYSTSVYSYTHDELYQMIIAKDFLNPKEKILIVDDFLAKGESSFGLVKICKEADVDIVAVVAVIEKSYQGGRKRIEDEEVKVYSLARIESMSDHNIKFFTE